MTLLALQALKVICIFKEGLLSVWFIICASFERVYAVHGRNYETKALLLIRNVKNTKLFLGQTAP